MTLTLNCHSKLVLVSAVCLMGWITWIIETAADESRNTAASVRRR